MSSKTKENIQADGEFFLKAKYLDLKTGHPWIVVIHEEDAKTYGVRAGDELTLKWNQKTTQVSVDLTKELVGRGEIGLFQDIITKYHIKEGEVLELALAQPPSSLESIRKKLLDKRLTYEEIRGVISDVVNYNLDDVQIAFFLASAFKKNGFSNEEIYFMTKAMAETGEMLFWERDLVADKHSIGGVPGNRTTPLVVSIVSSLGIYFPKSSSRAITSEAGTADVIEAIAPVELSSVKIKEVVQKTNACLVWGGALKLAPADDRILRVSYELGIEPYSKMIVSIMAKKVAMGATHLVIDLPIGPDLKISSLKDALEVKKIFEYLATKFKIKIKVLIEPLNGPVGRGIGPSLEIRDILKVLEQRPARPLDLEKRALKLAGTLLELTGVTKKGSGEKIALKQLTNGEALKQFKKIIAAQGGKAELTSETIPLGNYSFEVKSPKTGVISHISSRELIRMARLLGSPATKESGVYLNKVIGEAVTEGEALCTLYTNSQQRLDLALNELKKSQLYQIS
ncbi:MAG: phosphorylase [Patescibacteria group bacterium]|nr:phosphorylase [Patescibacteria group bacterium]